jgi:hypothetical protein
MTRPESTDALFDTSPRAMAARFGELAVCRIRAGRDPYEAARLAASYAREALREEEAAGVLHFSGGRRGGKGDAA